MTRTFSGASCSITYNEDDMLGNVTLHITDSNQRKTTVEVSGEDLYKYAIKYIREQKLRQIMSCSDKELLGISNT